MASQAGAAIGAIFETKSGADECVAELEQLGFARPWLAVAKTVPRDASADDPAGAQATYHEVVSSSDGLAGAAGRLVRGDRSLQHALEQHGLSEATAREIDAALPFGGGVVVVDAAERVDVAAATLRRAGATVYGAGATTVEAAPRDPVAAEAADMSASGTGRGASSGFLSDAAARLDPEIAPLAGEREHSSLVRDPKPAHDHKGSSPGG